MTFLLAVFAMLLWPVSFAEAQSMPSTSIPHFSRDGRILHQYEPGQSIFIRTLFKLRPPFIAETPGLLAKVKEAGVNVLTAGFFANPGDHREFKTYQMWAEDFQQRWGLTLAVSRQAGMPLCLLGDDFARFPRELHAVLTLPWAPHAVKTAVTAARDSHRVICIEMMDEVNAIWGDTPRPTDGRWQKKRPPIPDDAFVKLMQIINSVPNRPPLTWPVVNWSSPEAAKAWMGDPVFSDYATHYWYPGEFASISQNALDMDYRIDVRQKVLPPNRPFLVLTKVTGAFYTKQGPGGQYTPKQDKLVDAPYTPVSVAAQIMRAAALGAAGVRVYAFDSLWAQQRREAAVGETVETGTNPLTGIGLDRWRAMSAAFHLIEKIEPILLDRQLPADDWGQPYTTTARQGADGRIFMVVSNSDQTQTHALRLEPYLYPGGTIRQFTLLGEHLTEEALQTPPKSLTLKPGASVVWLFRPKA